MISLINLAFCCWFYSSLKNGRRGGLRYGVTRGFPYVSEQRIAVLLFAVPSTDGNGNYFLIGNVVSRLRFWHDFVTLFRPNLYGTLIAVIVGLLWILPKALLAMLPKFFLNRGHLIVRSEPTFLPHRAPIVCTFESRTDHFADSLLVNCFSLAKTWNVHRYSKSHAFQPGIDYG